MCISIVWNSLFLLHDVQEWNIMVFTPQHLSDSFSKLENASSRCWEQAVFFWNHEKHSQGPFYCSTSTFDALSNFCFKIVTYFYLNVVLNVELLVVVFSMWHCAFTQNKDLNLLVFWQTTLRYLEINVLSFWQFMAYQYYLKSAERGHIRGAVQLADIWTTGIPGRVNRRPSDAVLLVTSLVFYSTSHIWPFLLSWLKCLFNWLQVGKVGSWAQRLPGQHLTESLGFVSQEWHVIIFSAHTWSWSGLLIIAAN